MKYYKLFAAMALCASLSIFGDSSQSDCGSCGCANPCGCEQSCDTCCSSPCDCNTSCDPCNTCCCSPCCCEPCDFIPPCPPEDCAYNAPTVIDIKCSWDFFVTGSFVYFQAKEENLQIGETGVLEVNIPTGISLLTGEADLYTNRTKMCFDYEPAFKVGLGFDFGCDNWSFYAEYFRYHADVGSSSFSGSLPTSFPDGRTGLLLSSHYLIPDIFKATLPFIISVLANPAPAPEPIYGASISPLYTSTSGTGTWRLEMDTADFLIGREYYVGKCLTFNTQFGLRAAWINQYYDVEYNSVWPINEPALQAELDIVSNVNLSSCSWAVGAKAALHTDWRFCGGFYLYGDTSFDILYTDYETSQNFDVVWTDAGVQVDSFESPNNDDYDLCFLRPHAELGLGLGWADYFCCNDWYFDLKAGYEFHVYWNQNVFAMIPDFNQDAARLGGDLYLHGLVITARLDF